MTEVERESQHWRKRTTGGESKVGWCRDLYTRKQSYRQRQCEGRRGRVTTVSDWTNWRWVAGSAGLNSPPVIDSRWGSGVMQEAPPRRVAREPSWWQNAKPLSCGSWHLQLHKFCLQGFHPCMGSLPFRLICASKLVLGMTVSVYVYWY